MIQGQRVLILTEEEALGRRCEAVLHARGCACSRMAVDGDFSPGEWLEALAAQGHEVVLCEFRTSALSAVTLQRHLNDANYASQVQIAALGVEGSDPAEFHWLGGAAYEPIATSETELGVLLERIWQKLANHRQRMAGYRSEVLAYLESLRDERVFRRFALELFSHLDYKVHPAHGPSEAGKDLVLYEQNHMGELEYVGVQAKIGDIHGNVARAGSATALALQTMEAFNSRVRHKGKSHYLDKYVIMASGTISQVAREKLEELLRSNKYDKRVYYWGREEIADVKVQYARTYLRFPEQHAT